MRVSKRRKTTATSTAIDGHSSGTHPQSVQTLPQSFSLFQTAPSLDRIPDDVLFEILSHLPAICEHHVLNGQRMFPYLTQFFRTSTLRALSQTSRLLRIRCLAMAWQKIEICGPYTPCIVPSHRAIAETNNTAACVLEASPHLWPLIETVTVVLTRFQWTEILPKLATCLASLHNLHTIQVIYTENRMKTSIAKSFRGKRLPSVRKIYLPSLAHEIVKCCPNLEEVICTEGDGKQIMESLVKGHCHQLRVLKGFSYDFLHPLHENMAATISEFVDMVPDLKHIGLRKGLDMACLTSLPQLDTIEVFLYYREKRKGYPLSVAAAEDIEKAREILKESKSKAEKTIRLTRPVIERYRLEMEEGYTETELIVVE